LSVTSSFHNDCELLVIPGSLVDDDNEVKDKKGKSDKGETEYLSSSEGGQKSIMGIFAAHESGSSVGVNGNSHSNVSSGNGGSRADEVCKAGVWEVGSWSGSHLLPVNSYSQDDTEHQREDGEVQILLSQEADSTLSDLLSNKVHLLKDSIWGRFSVLTIQGLALCIAGLLDNLGDCGGIIHVHGSY